MSVRSGAAAFDTVALETSQTTSTQTTNLCNVDNSVPGGVGVCAERSHCWHHGTKHVGSRASAPSHVTRFLVSVEERHSSLTSVLTSIGTHHSHPFAQPFTSTVREGVCAWEVRAHLSTASSSNRSTSEYSTRSFCGRKRERWRV
jgi:hypothetical protein